MRLQIFNYRVYLILTNKRENYRMYCVSREKNWRILTETYEDQRLVLSTLNEKKPIDVIAAITREFREYCKFGYTWHSSTIATNKEPGIEFHEEMKKNGLTRAYEIACI